MGNWGGAKNSRLGTTNLITMLEFKMTQTAQREREREANPFSVEKAKGERQQ